MNNFEILTRHIAALEEEAGKESVSNSARFGYPDAVNSLHGDYFRFCDTCEEYSQLDFYEVLDENGIERSLDSMCGADVSALDAKAIIALFAGAWRAERFCDGAVMEFVENGTFVRWLKRLEELDEKQA